MAKAKKNPEEKKFINELALLFSSLSSRMCPYAYFNMRPNMVVLCNSTSPKSEHGNKLMEYSVADLALHLIYLKNTDVMQKVREFLKIPETGCYCVHAPNLVVLIKKYGLENLKVFVNEYGDTIVKQKSSPTYDVKNVIGWPVLNFHVEHNLDVYISQIEMIGTDEHKRCTAYIEQDIDPDIIMIGKQYQIEFDLDDFKLNGKPVFENMIKKMYMIFFDGTSSVSLKEFVKKMTIPYTLKLYAWVVVNSYFICESIFDSDWVKVISMRPNLLNIPIPDIHTTPSKVLMLYAEEDYGQQANSSE